MEKQPSGLKLLEITLKVFKEELLPDLPEKKRYNGLMVANALAILARQLQRSADKQIQEERALTLLLQGEGDVGSLNLLFAKRIRRGDFITPSEASKRAWRALFEITKANVYESNPKYLEK